MPARQNIIRNPIKDCHIARKNVVDGIINSSSYLTTFQRNAVDGIIKSPLTPSETKEAMSKKSCKVTTTKGKATATPQQIGIVHFPGSPYPRK